MDFTTHQFAECVENHTMPLDRRFSGKRFRNDKQTIVTATASGAGVSCMQGGVVDQFQSSRLQSRQALAEQQLDFGRAAQAGSTFLNGLTLTL